MSFTTDIKKEISSYNSDKTEVIAELSAALNISAIINDDGFEVVNENYDVIRRLYTLLKDLYHIDIVIESDMYNSLRKKVLSRLIVKERSDFILNDLNIVSNKERLFVPSNYIVDGDREKSAYLRGAFLMCGSINDPKTSRYNLEFVINSEATADFICKLLNYFNFNAKVIKRDKSFMVYLKQSEQISDFIKMLPAMRSLFYYEDIRIYRDLQNMVNRINNCEQANADKVISAAEEQLGMISKLRESVDFDLLEDGIKDVCIYREKYRDVSTRELAEIISYETGKPITKSGINHRFRKIKSILESK